MRRKPEIMLIAADDLRIDPDTQRQLRQPWVKHLAQNFDPTQLGVIQVSKRSNGDFYAMDGQHRIFACRYRGEGDRRLTCEVHTGLSRGQEGTRFDGLNTQKPVSAFDRFHVRLSYDPDAQAIEKAVNAIGMKIHNQTGDGFITAVSALKDIYFGKLTRSKEPTPWALSASLRTMHDAWGNDRDAYVNPMLKGCAGVHLRYGDDIDKAHFSRALGGFSGGPVQMLVKAKILHGYGRGLLWTAVAEVMVQTYNKGRRKSALPQWQRS